MLEVAFVLHFTILPFKYKARSLGSTFKLCLCFFCSYNFYIFLAILYAFMHFAHKIFPSLALAWLCSLFEKQMKQMKKRVLGKNRSCYAHDIEIFYVSPFTFFSKVLCALKYLILLFNSNEELKNGWESQQGICYFSGF